MVEKNLEELAMVAFQIIASVGTARSCYIDAIQKAKACDFEGAEASITEGDEAFVEGHDAHSSLLQKEAEGNDVVCLLVLHAEDQLMSAEGFKTIALEMIDLYKRIDVLEKK